MGYIKGYQAYKNKEIKYKNPDPEAFRDTYNIRSYLKIITRFPKWLTKYNAIF